MKPGNFWNKSRIWPLALLLGFSSVTAQNDQGKGFINSQWQNYPLKVDGDASDWKDSLTLTDNKTGIQFGISNDAHFLYIRMRVNNQMTQTRMLCGGLKTGLNIRGKKRPSATLAFPMKLSSDDLPGGQRPDLRASRLTGFLKAKTLELEGFRKGDGTYPIDADNPDGIHVGLSFSKMAQLVYEVSIPFSAFLHDGDLVDADSTLVLAVGFLIDPMPTAFSPSNETPPAGPPAGGGRRRGGGGGGSRPPASPISSQGSRPASHGLREQTKTWELVHLAHQS